MRGKNAIIILTPLFLGGVALILIFALREPGEGAGTSGVAPHPSATDPATAGPGTPDASGQKGGASSGAARPGTTRGDVSPSAPARQRSVPSTLRPELAGDWRAYLDGFEDPGAKAAEYMRILGGTSDFLKDPRFSGKYRGGIDLVQEWTSQTIIDEIEDLEEEAPEMFESALTLLRKGLKDGLPEGKSARHLIRAFAALGTRADKDGKKTADFVRNHRNTPSIARVMSELDPKALSDSTEYRDAVLEVFHTTQAPEVRTSAAWELCSWMGRDPQVRRKLKGAYWESAGGARSAVIAGLKRCDLRVDDVYTFAFDLLRNETSPHRQGDLISVLSARRNPPSDAAIQFVRVCLTSESAVLRKSSAQYLRYRGGAQDVATLRSLAQNDPDAEVRSAAAEALAALKK